MKRLIIHAGLPKTGSSALQVYLAQNRETLRFASIDYLRLGEFAAGAAGKISSGNGSLAARSLLPASNTLHLDASAGHLDALRNALSASDCTTGLVSGEFFASADPDRLAAFVSRLRLEGFKPVFVYFIRAQVPMLASMYVQDVKRGWCEETADQNIRGRYKRERYLLYATFHSEMCDIFGSDNVICKVYEETRNVQDGLRRAFLDAIGAKPQFIRTEMEQINTTLSPSDVIVMRALNKYRPRMQFSDMLVENSLQSGRYVDANARHLLSFDLRTEISQYFATENSEMARIVFQKKELFPEERIPNDCPSSDENLSARDLIDTLGGLIVQYDHRLAELEKFLHREREGICASVSRLISGFYQALKSDRNREVVGKTIDGASNSSMFMNSDAG